MITITAMIRPPTNTTSARRRNTPWTGHKYGDANRKKGVNPLCARAGLSFNASMHVRTWTRCMARDAETGAWCQHRPTHGVFCASHVWDFQCDEAAKAATRLVQAGLVLKDPSAPTLHRWRAALQAHRARSLRRYLLNAMAGLERSHPDTVFAPDDLVPDSRNGRRR